MPRTSNSPGQGTEGEESAFVWREVGVEPGSLTAIPLATATTIVAARGAGLDGSGAFFHIFVLGPTRLLEWWHASSVPRLFSKGATNASLGRYFLDRRFVGWSVWLVRIGRNGDANRQDSVLCVHRAVRHLIGHGTPWANRLMKERQQERQQERL
jgi:hypothetical protein